MSKFVIDSPSEIGYILFMPQGVNDKIFENLADSNQPIYRKPRQRLQSAKLRAKTEGKGLRQGCDKAVEWHFDGCFQQKWLPPGGGNKDCQYSTLASQNRACQGTRLPKLVIAGIERQIFTASPQQARKQVSNHPNEGVENSLNIASTARSPLGRNAFRLLFAIKMNMPGGVCG